MMDEENIWHQIGEKQGLGGKRVLSSSFKAMGFMSYYYTIMQNPHQQSLGNGIEVEYSLTEFKSLCIDSCELKRVLKYRAMTGPIDDLSKSINNIVNTIGGPLTPSPNISLSSSGNMQSHPQTLGNLPSEVPQTKRDIIRSRLKMEHGRLSEALMKCKREQNEARTKNLLLKQKLQELTQNKKSQHIQEQLQPLLNSHKEIRRRQLDHKLTKYKEHIKMLELQTAAISSTNYQ